MRRLLVGVVASMVLLWPQPAGARQDYRDVGWWLTSSSVHVAHAVQGVIPGWNSNYLLVRVVWPFGAYEFTAGVWFDSWCELTVEPGDGAGLPLRLRWRSTVPGFGCAPGAGVYVWTGNWATATEGYVFPRNAADPWSRSTVVEVR